MKIPVNVWIKYRDTLARINSKAADEMTAFLEKIGGYGGHEEQVIDFAYALASKYGEATASLACEMYDAVARASGVNVPPAEPAEPATYEETAKAIRGSARQSESIIPQTASRLVKQAGADTTLKNAARDGAKFAWIPTGDTCAFCITLASRGWQKQSKKARMNGHAEHIHAHCNCEYATSFRDGAEYASFYNPDKYLEMYNNAEGDTWKEKVNSMRREHYANNKDMINAQKRAAYAKKTEQENSTKVRKNLVQNTLIDRSFINSNSFRNKIDSITESVHESRHITKIAREILEHRDGTFYEDLAYLDSKSRHVIINKAFDYYVDGVSACKPNKKMNEMLGKSAPNTIIGIHNHPKSSVPSIGDLIAAKERRYKYGIVICHDGRIYKYSVKEDFSDYTFAKMRLERLGDAVYNNNREKIQRALEALEEIGIIMEVG